ncbi:hypothetical protein SARC_08860 [Sphaeroforma arctica JP610]|uniref:Uncharacterized protein n=1 Tax=Sphaeroforma arctica JP610 TaxID=667725 RepID=A0A0L0FQB1_9EUKA|nr:hypothetical protein SARC_08860 [Sphaeroforma arctica JP610]KNC78721.1 hypothetical protein SARC_08860 [Sphaeroforma arctica JP610]|eukprot:XP_014152623.1 hypothetical protein SARC_08860 [Sphaeroforma arctica JP610]
MQTTKFVHITPPFSCLIHNSFYLYIPDIQVQTTVPDQDTSIFNWNFIETFANNSTTATDFKRSVSHFESSIFHSSSDHNSTPSSPTVSPTHSPVFRRSNPGAIHELHNQSAATGHPSGSRIGTDNTEVKAGGVVRTNTHATIHANAKAYTPSHSSQLLRPQPTIRTAKSVNATPSQHPMFNRLQGDNGNHSRDRIPSEDDGDVLFSNNASKSPADSPRVAGTSERAMKFLGLDDQHDDTYGDGPPPSPLEALTKKFILPLLW